MYIRLPDLLTDLALGREQGNYKKILRRYEKVDLLIIDEWLLIPANDIAQQHILESFREDTEKKERYSVLGLQRIPDISDWAVVHWPMRYWIVYCITHIL